jgi:hypothetical protein
MQKARDLDVLGTENEGLKRQIKAVTLKCEDAEAMLVRQHQRITAMQDEKEGAAAAQGERVATIERMQRLQFQSKLELNSAHNTIRIQDERIRKLENELRNLRATPSSEITLQPRLGREAISDAGSSYEAAIAVRDQPSREYFLLDKEFGPKSLAPNAQSSGEAESARTKRASILELQGLLQEVAPNALNNHLTHTVLPSHLLRRSSPQSAVREQRGDATVESSLASPLLEQRLMGARGQVLLDSVDVSPLVRTDASMVRGDSDRSGERRPERRDDVALSPTFSSSEGSEYRV